MSRAFGVGGIAGAGLLVLLGGCAPLPAPTPTPTPQTSRVVRATPAPAETTRAAVPVPAPVDSGPSREALEILRTIPEPVPGASGGVNTTTTEAPGAEIPTPSPTEPLGERPGSAEEAAADTASSEATPPGPPPSFGTPDTSRAQPPPFAEPVHPDSCWSVQVAAPLEREEAEQKRSAAESLLLVSMEIVDQEGRHKVRSRGCLNRAGAERLRDRAESSGFEGAFLVRGSGP